MSFDDLKKVRTHRLSNALSLAPRQSTAVRKAKSAGATTEMLRAPHTGTASTLNNRTTNQKQSARIEQQLKAQMTPTMTGKGSRALSYYHCVLA